MFRAHLIASLVLLLVAAAASSAQANESHRRLNVVNPDVVWDETAVRLDLDANGSVDSAHIGRANGRVYVGLVLGGSDQVETADFAISGSLQAAICSEPATLSAEEFSNPVEDVGPLAGARREARIAGLELSGGECDSIHLYWNHDRRKLSWWRR